MCWSTLESIMGTAHGADELGLCSHGLACQASAWGRHHRVMPRIWPYWTKYYELNLEKYPVRLITLSHDGILTNGLLFVKCRTLEMRMVVSREWIAQRTRERVSSYWHILTGSIFTNIPLVLLHHAWCTRVYSTYTWVPAGTYFVLNLAHGTWSKFILQL